MEKQKKCKKIGFICGERRGQFVASFIPFYYAMLNSTAYRELCPSAAKALPFFLAKVKWGGDLKLFDTPFKFSCREAKRHGFSYSTFCDHIVPELQKKGFILVGPKVKGKPNRYALSFKWFFYGSPEEKPQVADDTPSGLPDLEKQEQEKEMPF
ncbi:MAG: hypothetical protein BA869_05550 [Desulfuromonadales bacterium C00003107]|nr:MAG: hypothetical protein BA869_05550 [Desulfuromonadales bacterium C00003107]